MCVYQSAWMHKAKYEPNTVRKANLFLTVLPRLVILVTNQAIFGGFIYLLFESCDYYFLHSYLSFKMQTKFCSHNYWENTIQTVQTN